MWSLARMSGGGKISGLLADLRVVGEQHLGRALDRTDVVDVGLDLRRDLRVVAEVDHDLRRVRVRGGLRDQAVVGPQHPALVGDREAQGRLVDQGLDHVARPGHRQDGVAALEVLGVGVALEQRVHAGVLDLLDLGDRGVAVAAGRRRRVEPELEHRQADRVAHLGQVVDAALVLEVEERVEAGQVAGLRLVVAEPGHPRLPRHVVVVGRIPGDVAVDVLQVGRDVRHVAEVHRLDPAEPDQPSGHPVGDRDRCPSRCPGRPRAAAWIVPMKVSLSSITSL